MHDPATEAPTAALVDHVLSRHHDTHRRELPDLIAMARKVETVHADDPNTPHGLSHALGAMIADLETHMRREEKVLFPARKSGSSGNLKRTITCLRDEHAGQETALNRIAEVTHGFRLPSYACRTRSGLHAGVGKLVDDLDEHMHLENEMLFPRFEARG